MGKVVKRAPDGGAIAAWRQAAKAWRESVVVVQGLEGARVQAKEALPNISEAERKRYDKAREKALKDQAQGKTPNWPKPFGPFPLPECHAAAVALAEATSALAELAREHKESGLLASKLVRRAREWSTLPSLELLEAVRDVEVLADELEALLGMREQQRSSAVVLGNPLTDPILEALRLANGTARMKALANLCAQYGEDENEDDLPEAKQKQKRLALEKRIRRHVEAELAPDLVRIDEDDRKLYVLTEAGWKLAKEARKRLQNREK